MLKFKRTTTDKLSIKGLLSEDCSTILYADENKEDQVVKVVDLLNAFKDCPIELTVTLKDEDDLELIPVDD